MIKVIAFDLVGVLVKEKNIQLTEQETKLERLFGPNISDEDYLNKASLLLNEEIDIPNLTKDIINKLYEVKDISLISKIVNKFPEIKIIIATNHVSYIEDYIKNNITHLDRIYISAKINEIKPNKKFYKYICDDLILLPSEILFLDDNIDNINVAKEYGLNTIHIEKNTDIFSEIIHKLK